MLATSFQGYRVSQIHLTPVNYPIITYTTIVYVHHTTKPCYFTLEIVTRVNLEGGSDIIFIWTYMFQFPLFLDVKIDFR